MFEEFVQLAMVPTPEQLQARFAAPVLMLVTRTAEERRALDTAKRRIRFELHKRLSVLR